MLFAATLTTYNRSFRKLERRAKGQAGNTRAPRKSSIQHVRSSTNHRTSSVALLYPRRGHRRRYPRRFRGKPEDTKGFITSLYSPTDSPGDDNKQSFQSLCNLSGTKNTINYILYREGSIEELIDPPPEEPLQASRRPQAIEAFMTLVWEPIKVASENKEKLEVIDPLNRLYNKADS